MTVTAQQIHGHMTQHREILSPVALTNATRIFAKAYIQDPMEPILHPLMPPNCTGKTARFTGQRRQIIAPLNRHRITHFAL